jgi:hypothetical protein
VLSDFALEYLKHVAECLWILTASTSWQMSFRNICMKSTELGFGAGRHAGLISAVFGARSCDVLKIYKDKQKKLTYRLK